MSSGCGTTVIPPGAPIRPTTIYLCDYGVHSSLLLPVGAPVDRRYVEYLYGDWNWAALGHTGWTDAVGAIFFSQQATLGRRFITMPDGTSRPVLDPSPKTQVSLVINGDGCDSIVKSLDHRWESQKQTATIPKPNDGYCSYVKDDSNYSWLHDCNHHTADCLKAMGCRVNGFATLSDFHVVEKTK